jgi:hypothetical protein
MKRMHAVAAAMALTVSSAAVPASAENLFNLDLTVNPNTPGQVSNSVSFGTVTDLANALRTQNLTSIVNSYTDISAASATMLIRGLPATASYQANSTALRFVVPAAGVDITFNGATRDDSQQQLKDFLLKNGGSLATKLLQALVANSPIDPVAGNPNSLENLGASNDFGVATGIGLGAEPIPGPNAGPKAGLLGQPNLISLGGDLGVSRSGGFTSEIVTLPFRYIIPLKDPRYAVTIDAPISYVNTEGASSYFGSIGVSVRIPISGTWFISPSIRYGASGSVDLGAGAMQISGGVASRYNIYFNDLSVTVGNGVTVARTLPLSIGSVSVNYDLTNVLLNNGVQVEGSLPTLIYGRPTSWQAYLIDTYVAGSDVYINHYDEIGASFGTRHGVNTQNWDDLRVGVAFIYGTGSGTGTLSGKSHDYQSLKLQLSYRF